MTPTFAEWLRWASRTIQRVAVFEPNLVLRGWTAVGGGAPNTYAIDLPQFVFGDLIAGGLYRACVGLTQNDDRLTERASLAAVDANAGSWWYDAATETLYAHSTSGADPDAFTVYFAQVQFRLATRGRVIDLVDGDPTSGVYHHPWLTRDVPSTSSAVEDFFHGQKLTATTQITVLNEAYVWYRLLATDGAYWWKNTKVRFYIGGGYNGMELPWSEYAADLTMLVEDAACDDEVVRFQLKPLVRQTNVEVPVTPYFESEYPNLGDGVRGTKKWVGYGRATMHPDLTDTTSHGVWTVADAAFQTLFAVHGVNAIAKDSGQRLALSLGTDYTVDLTACTVTIVNAAYAWGTYDLEVDVTGKPDGLGSYLRTGGAIIKDLLITFAGVDPDDIHTAAFAQVDADAPEELSVWLKSPRTLSSILSTSGPGFPSIEGSILATVQQTQAGQWTCFVWTPNVDTSTAVHLTAADFVLFRPEPKLETVYHATLVYFNQNLATGDWPAEQATDVEVGYLSKSVDVLTRHTFLRAAADALTLAQRMQLLSGAQSLEIEFVERGSLLAQQLAGAKVLITRNPAPSASGEFAAKPFEIIRLDRQPDLAIAGRFSDLRGIGGVIGHWKADTDPAWSAMTPTAREASPGFWTDDNGRPDAGDPASAGASVYW